MCSLLKANFYKVLKSKLTLAFVIVMAIFAFMTSFLYMIIMKSLDASSAASFSQLANGRYLFSASFTMSSNIGLIVPVVSVLFITSDVSNGTLRNKVVVGQSRLKVYLSHLIVNSSTCAAFIFINTMLNLIFSSAFFGWGSAFNGNSFIFIVQMELLGICTYVMIASIGTMLALCSKSTAATIIFLVLIIFVFTYMTNIPSFLDDVEEKYQWLFYLIPEYALYSGIYLVGQSVLDIGNMLLGIIIEILLSVVFSVFGFMIFSSKDIK